MIPNFRLNLKGCCSIQNVIQLKIIDDCSVKRRVVWEYSEYYVIFMLSILIRISFRLFSKKITVTVSKIIRTGWVNSNFTFQNICFLFLLWDNILINKKPTIYKPYTMVHSFAKMSVNDLDFFFHPYIFLKNTPVWLFAIYDF